MLHLPSAVAGALPYHPLPIPANNHSHCIIHSYALAPACTAWCPLGGARLAAIAGHCRHPTPQETDDLVPITPLQLDDSTTAAAQVALQNLTTFTVRGTMGRKNTSTSQKNNNHNNPFYLHTACVYVHDGQRSAASSICPAAGVVTSHMPAAVTHRPCVAPSPPAAAARTCPWGLGDAAAIC